MQTLSNSRLHAAQTKQIHDNSPHSIGTQPRLTEGRTVSELTHRVHVKGVEEIKGNGSEKVQQKPATHVVEGNQPGIVANLAIFVDERCPEVQHNVCNTTQNGISVGL